MVGSGEATVSYIDQMVLGQLVAGLRDKEFKREIMEKAGIKGIKTSKLILRQVERLVRIKKQAKEDATNLNLGGRMEPELLNRVSAVTAELSNVRIYIKMPQKKSFVYLFVVVLAVVAVGNYRGGDLVYAVGDGDALAAPPPQGQARHPALPWGSVTPIHYTSSTITPAPAMHHSSTTAPPVSMPESGSEWLPLLLVSSEMPELESLGTRPRSHRRACAVVACRSFSTWGVVQVGGGRAGGGRGGDAHLFPCLDPPLLLALRGPPAGGVPEASHSHGVVPRHAGPHGDAPRLPPLHHCRLRASFEPSGPSSGGRRLQRPARICFTHRSRFIYFKI